MFPSLPTPFYCFSNQVVSPFPPSDKVGIKSIQRVEEEIIPMKAMKLAWVPYIPLENRWSLLVLTTFLKLYFVFSPSDFDWSRYGYSSKTLFFYRQSQVDRLKTQIFTMGCTQRRYWDIYFISVSVSYACKWIICFSYGSFAVCMVAWSIFGILVAYCMLICCLGSWFFLLYINYSVK